MPRRAQVVAAYRQPAQPWRADGTRKREELGQTGAAHETLTE